MSWVRLAGRLLLPGLLMLVASCRSAPPIPPSAASEPLFQKLEPTSGIDFVHRTGLRKALNIYQGTAGGCGLLDYDGDGLLDIFLVQGSHQPGAGGGNRLYRNLGGNRFQDVTEAAGLRGGQGYGMGCAVGDYDGDGHPDLYVCNYGTSELYRNRGDGTFQAVGAQTGTAVKGCAVGAVFADLDGDRRPDLYVVRYVRLGANDPLLCSQSGVPITCGPATYEAEPGVFLRNMGNGRFEDRTKVSGLVNPGRGMGALASDLNGDGLLDLLVTNDTSANALFLGDGRGRFRDAALDAGVAFGELGAAEANMGCDLGDLNGDGRPELVIGVLQDRATLLFRNEGAGLFTLASRQSGLASPTRGVTTFGCGFLDVDHDGDLDLFQANGHVFDRVGEISPGTPYRQPRQLFLNDGRGNFMENTAAGGAALVEPGAGRGAAFGDLDNDGDVDIVVNNLDGPPTVLINMAEKLGRHWLRVRLEGKAPDLRAEGAELRLRVGGRTLLRHAHSAYSYASANDIRVHFGLGSETAIGPLEIRWPDGKRQEVAVAGVDRELVVRQAP